MPDFLYASLPPTDETVSQCVARLGPPPDDIANEWVEEAIELTGRDDLTSFEPDADLWKTIYVGTDGRLRTDHPRTIEVSVVRSENESEASSSDSEDEQRAGLIWSRWFLASVAILVFAGLAWLLFSAADTSVVASRSNTDSSATSQLEQSNADRLSMSLPSTEPMALLDDSIGNDEQLELLIDEVDAFAASKPAGLGLSLDDFLPPSQTDSSTKTSEQPAFAPEDAPDGPSSQESVPTEEAVLGQPRTTDISPTDILAIDDEDESAMLDEADEQSTTRRDPIERQVTGVGLPSPPRRAESTLPETVSLLTVGRVPDSIELQMPSGSTADFSLQREKSSPSSWLVTQSEADKPIAKVIGDANNDDLQFQWLDASRDFSLSSALTHGRLHSSDGDVIYLRPRLDTEKIKLTLAKRDLKLKWNLQTPIPPRGTEIRMSVAVPKDVELQWIEPIDSASPRSTRGVALLRLKTSETTGIVVRIDVKTTNSLSIRLRFGARLDPAMPWQWTDAPSIRESFEAVTKQLEVADAQLLNLDVAISRAKRIRARRQEYLLEEQRDRIDEAVKGWTTVANRLAELDQLVAFLDAGASLSPELVVRWDDGDQVILGVPTEVTTE